MQKIRLFDSFAGIGALHKALKNIGLEVELIGMSEIDIEAIRSYNAIHYNNNKWEDIKLPSKEEMEKYLQERNIGFDFKTKKCKLPKGEKLKEVYRICKALNNYGDISLINPKDLPDFDLFNFSFPCQDISIAGYKKGLVDEDGNITRSGLYIYGMEIIKAKKPKYIMIENVKNLIGKKFKTYFDDMIKELNEIGYNTYWKVLNAKDYGIPQNRERVFVICIRKDIDDNNFEFPKPFDSGLRLKDFLDKEVDKKYYIDDERVERLLSKEKYGKKGFPPKENLDAQVSYSLDSREHRKSGWKEECPALCSRDYKSPKVISIACEERTDEGLRFFKDNICGALRSIDTCGDKRILEVRPCLTPDRINKRQNGRRFKEDGEPSFTITAQDRHGVLIKENIIKEDKNTETTNSLKFIGGLENKWLKNDAELSRNYKQGYRVYDSNGIACTQSANGGGLGAKTGLYLINYKIRKLTPIECYRLMGFKDEDIQKVKNIGMSDTQMYKQAGNSIVVNVLEEIFKNLFLKK